MTKKHLPDTGTEQEVAVPVFIFDDHLIEDTLPHHAAEPDPLRLGDSEDLSEKSGDAAAEVQTLNLAETATDSDSALPAFELQPRAPRTWRTVPPGLRLLGAALVLIGICLFAAQHLKIGFGPLAQPAARNLPAPAPEAQPAAGSGVAGISRPAVPAAAGQRTVPPAIPKSRVSRPSRAARTASSQRPPRRTRPKPVPAVKRAVPAGVVPRVEDDEEEALFTRAEKYLQAGAPDRAEALYRRIVREGRQQGRAALALGDLFAEKGDYQSATQSYRESERLYRAAAGPAAAP